MVASLSVFYQRSGIAVFTCTDCGYTVHQYGPGAGFPVCQTCRFIGENPHIPEEIRQLLQGEPAAVAVAPIPIEIGTTERGDRIGRFSDKFGEPCSIQTGSQAGDDHIWLGLDVSPRMHLTREQVAGLLPHLQKFVAEGGI